MMHSLSRPNVQAHLESNADDKACVESMEKGFFNRFKTRVNAMRIFMSLHNANTLQYVKEDVLKDLNVATCEGFRNTGCN